MDPLCAVRWCLRVFAFVCEREDDSIGIAVDSYLRGLLSCFDYFSCTNTLIPYHLLLQNSAIEKTKKEDHPDLFQIQQDRLREIQMEKKQAFKRSVKEKAEQKRQAMEEKEAKSYDRIMKEENMVTNKALQATVDATAAEEYEDDFM